jgi:hypothetical protein
VPERRLVLVVVLVLVLEVIRSVGSEFGHPDQPSGQQWTIVDHSGRSRQSGLPPGSDSNALLDSVPRRGERTQPRVLTLGFLFNTISPSQGASFSSSSSSLNPAARSDGVLEYWSTAPSPNCTPVRGVGDAEVALDLVRWLAQVAVCLSSPVLKIFA